jgi:hypothetical protein
MKTVGPGEGRTTDTPLEWNDWTVILILNTIQYEGEGVSWVHIASYQILKPFALLWCEVALIGGGYRYRRTSNAAL